jgi:hypothetical protein
MPCELDPETLIEALYGEASPAALERVRRHVAGCPACRQEWQSFTGVRRQLAAWRLPAWSRPRLGLVARAQVWRLAAAAVLLLALFAGLGLSRARVGYGPGGLALSFGHTEADVERLLQEQEQRHSLQLAALETRLARPGLPAPVAVAAREEAAGLEPVRRLIRESELRQAQRVELVLADQRERLETQRRYDLARISAGLSYLDGKNGQHMARTSELMGYLLQASDQR